MMNPSLFATRAFAISSLALLAGTIAQTSEAHKNHASKKHSAEHTLTSGAGIGCLDIDFQTPTGQGNHGYNVIVWPDCHGGENQQWKWDGQLLKARVNDRTYCLDINTAEKTGSGGAGFNIIAWPDCHGGWNQRWSRGGNASLVNTGLGRNICVDANRQDPRGHEGAGRNIITWGCTGASNQQWRHSH